MSGHLISFPNNEKSSRIPCFLLFGGILVAFLVANLPPSRIMYVAGLVLGNKSEIPFSLSTVSSIKGFIFYYFSLSILVMAIISGTGSKAGIFQSSKLKSYAIKTLLFTMAIVVLVFPYSYPGGYACHRSGLGSYGQQYGLISFAPFGVESELFYRRLFLPALAHLFQMQYTTLYWIFFLVIVFIFIGLVLYYLDLKTNDVRVGKFSRAIIYLSLLTSTFVVFQFQHPGYPEVLVYAMVLAMACFPMNNQARLSIIALCLITHDGAFLLLLPVILFCFPKKEMLSASVVLGSYVLIVLAGYQFRLVEMFSGHNLTTVYSPWGMIVHHSRLVALGVFYSYKLLWFLILPACWLMWRYDRRTCFACLSFLLAGGIVAEASLDTTRLWGFSFMAFLLVICTFLRKVSESKSVERALSAICIINILIPTKLIFPFAPESVNYTYAGLYRFISHVAFFLP